MGKSIVHLHKVNKCNHTDWFILKNEKNDVVGSILICLTIGKIGGSQMEDDCPSDDLEEEQESIAESRVEELSRSVAMNKRHTTFTRGLGG